MHSLKSGTSCPASHPTSRPPARSSTIPLQPRRLRGKNLPRPIPLAVTALHTPQSSLPATVVVPLDSSSVDWFPLAGVGARLLALADRVFVPDEGFDGDMIGGLPCWIMMIRNWRSGKTSHQCNYLVFTWWILLRKHKNIHVYMYFHFYFPGQKIW